MGFLQDLVQKVKEYVNDPRVDALEPVCRNIRKDFHGYMLWEQDERFRAVLSPFGLADGPYVREILDNYFPSHLTYANAANAPERVQYIFREIGALTPDKELYVMDSEKEIIVYAAWWPWEDRRTATLRIGFVTPDFLPGQEKKLFRKFRTWFGLIVLD